MTICNDTNDKEIPCLQCNMDHYTRGICFVDKAGTMIGRIVAHVHVQREILSSFSPRVQFPNSNLLENTMLLQCNHSSTATQLCSTSSRVAYSVHQF